MAAGDGVPVDGNSDGFLDQPGQDLVDEPDGGFVVDPTGVDQAGDAELVALHDSPEPMVVPVVVGNPTGTETV